MYGFLVDSDKTKTDLSSSSLAYRALKARENSEKTDADANKSSTDAASSGVTNIFSNYLNSSMQSLMMQSQISGGGLETDAFSSVGKNVSYPKGVVNSLIERISKEEGVDPKLVKLFAWRESRFKSNVTSKCGAMGVMQLMPATAKQFGCKNGYDPEQNIRAGCKLLNYLVKKYNGNTSEIAKVYSSGTKGNVGSVTLAYMKYLVEAVGDNVNVN